MQPIWFVIDTTPVQKPLGTNYNALTLLTFLNQGR